MPDTTVGFENARYKVLGESGSNLGLYQHEPQEEDGAGSSRKASLTAEHSPERGKEGASRFRALR